MMIASPLSASKPSTSPLSASKPSTSPLSASKPSLLRFQGQLWINLTTDERPMETRLDNARTAWRAMLETGGCPSLEEEVIREERSRATLPGLKTLLAGVLKGLNWTEASPAIGTNTNQTQASIDFGDSESLRAALKAALRESGILYFDTEKAFLCNLKVGETLFKDPFASLEGRVGKLLLDMKLKISTAESCTGGLIGSRLTDVKASGNYIEYGDLVYCNAAKREALGLDLAFLDREGPYNETTAKQMAEGSLKRLGPNGTPVDVAISITGLAGHHPEYGVPAGTAFVGIAGLTPETQVFTVKLPAEIPKDRKKYLFSEFALYQLEKLLRARSGLRLLDRA